MSQRKEQKRRHRGQRGSGPFLGLGGVGRGTRRGACGLGAGGERKGEGPEGDRRPGQAKRPRQAGALGRGARVRVVGKLL